MLHKEDVAISVDRQTAGLLETLTPPPGTEPVAFADVGVELAREGARNLFLGFAGTPDASCTTRDIRIDAPFAHIPARVYSPPDAAENTLPLVIYLHGGGWAMGDLDSYDGLLRSLCTQSGVRMLSVAYRRAPEHKFPAGLDDTLYAIRWARAAHQDLQVDPDRIALMGDSAGGNLAAVAARRARIEGDIALSAQFLIYPVLDVSRSHSAYPSRMTWGDGDYLLSRESIDVTLGWYLGNDDRADNPDVSPLLSPDIDRLPPTVIVAAGCDPLLDESVHYADLLRAAGVRTTFRSFERTIHAFLSFGTLDIAQRARTWLANEIKCHLRGQEGPDTF